MMCTKGIYRTMIERDPFLRSNIESKKHQEDIHKAYLQLSQSISDMLKPPTPEPEEDESHRKSKSNGRKSKQRSRSRRSNRSAMSNYASLDKYRIQATPSLREPKSRQSHRPSTRKEKRKNCKIEAPSLERTSTSFGEPRQKYSIRYSKVLDIFKRKMYREIIDRLGIHINNLDDPDLVEIDLAWCKVGTFILESRENTGLSFAQFVEETASVVDDFDDRMSMYSSFSSFLPPIGRGSSAVHLRVSSPREGATPLARSPIPDIFDSSKSKPRSHLKVDDGGHLRQSKVPKLPAIGEDY